MVPTVGLFIYVRGPHAVLSLRLFYSTFIPLLAMLGPV